MVYQPSFGYSPVRSEASVPLSGSAGSARSVYTRTDTRMFSCITHAPTASIRWSSSAANTFAQSFASPWSPSVSGDMPSHCCTMAYELPLSPESGTNAAGLAIVFSQYER